MRKTSQNATHVGFMDDARLSESVGVKSVALATMAYEDYAELRRRIEPVVLKHRNTELGVLKPMHFVGLNSCSSAERYLEVLKVYVDLLPALRSRIDILTWDDRSRNQSALNASDNAHKLQKLLRRVVEDRWRGGHWEICTDRDSPIDWDFASLSPLGILRKKDLAAGSDIMIQICDVMCGMANFYHRITNPSTRAEEAKMHLVQSFVAYVSESNPEWGIHLDPKKGLITPLTTTPVNFWVFKNTRPRGERPPISKREARKASQPAWMFP